MNCFEQDFLFEEKVLNVMVNKERPMGHEEVMTREELANIEMERSIDQSILNEPSVLGLRLRLGNEPIVKNLEKLYLFSGKTIPADLQVLFEKKDLYMIVHMIGAVRLEGSAKVEELQYEAQVVNQTGVQTIDLLPNTTFKTVFSAGLGIEGAISAGGSFSAKVPAALTQALLDQEISLGGDMKIQLSSNANFVGKFSFSLKFPVIQSNGVSSSFCTWILNPHENPLLGDQLLIQTIAVPKGTERITFKAKGLCKADKGLFWKQQIMATPEYTLDVDLT